MDKTQFANLIVPAHTRTSCSDDRRANGFGSRSISFERVKKDEDGKEWRNTTELSYFRCTRCAVLEILEGYEPGEEMQAYLESGHEIVMAAIRFTKQ